MSTLQREQFVELDHALTGRPSNLVWINENELAYASVCYRDDDENLGICIYNIMTNKWRLHVKYPNPFKSTRHTIIYNPKTNILWLYGEERNMININMETKEFKIIKPNAKYLGYCPKLFFINGRLHAILGSDSTQHLIWNDDTMDFEQEIFTFPGLKRGLHAHGVVHLRNKNELYLFGGYDYMSSSSNHVVWKCNIDDMKTLKWEIYQEDMRFTSYYHGYISTNDERYIVIFKEPIHIFDIENKIWYKVPGEYEYWNEALSGRDEKDEMMITGYIKDISKKLDIVIPVELIAIFANYYVSDMVYLIDNNGKFCKIRLNDILNVERVKKDD